LQISQYFKDNKQPIHMDRRTTFEQFHKQTKDEAHKMFDQPAKETYTIRWVCEHFGSQRESVIPDRLLECFSLVLLGLGLGLRVCTISQSKSQL